MNRLNRVFALLGCLLVAAGLSGCAKPRTGPFDVPSAMPSSVPPAASPDAVNRAAVEIAAAKVYFAFNRADLRPEARAALDTVAALLKRNPSIRVSIQGHCDERGGREYNFDLGARRARAAYRYLLDANVPPRQMEMVTYGKLSPIVPGGTEGAYAMNRRAEFVILTTCY